MPTSVKDLEETIKDLEDNILPPLRKNLEDYNHEFLKAFVDGNEERVSEYDNKIKDVRQDIQKKIKNIKEIKIKIKNLRHEHDIPSSTLGDLKGASKKKGGKRKTRRRKHKKKHRKSKRNKRKSRKR